MIQENKELLLKDLCARLPYGVIVDRLETPHKVLSIEPSQPNCIIIDRGEFMPACYSIEDIKPYLRSMSSMTKDEEKEYNSFIGGIEPFSSDFSAYPKEYKFVYEFDIKNYIDWLNAHHFDYRGLIDKGLALEAPEGMYNVK